MTTEWQQRHLLPHMSHDLSSVLLTEDDDDDLNINYKIPGGPEEDGGETTSHSPT